MMMMMMVMLLALLSTVPRGVCASHLVSKVKCLIINLEYMNCTWNPRHQHLNYSFHSKFGEQGSYSECPWYLWINSSSVGCQVPYILGKRFSRLHTKLSHGNISIHEIHDLRQEVKMEPPQNLSVKVSTSTGLWFSWSISHHKKCIEYVVRYRKDNRSWTNTTPTQLNYFNIPLPSEYSMYTFQVKMRIHSVCGMSKFWSEWSVPVSWGPLKYPSESLVSPDAHNSQVLLYSLLVGVILFVLACMLIQYERLKVIFIPAVPNPGKNLEDLFHTYNGNVEEWLHISKEFVDGFKANFSECACPVQEYRLLPQTSSSSSECSLPILTDQSDCFSTSSSTCTSTFPVLLEDTPPASV